MALYHGYGKVTREYKSLKPDRLKCGGCYCAPYWHGLGGSTKCWHFDDAKIVDKEAYRDLNAFEPSKFKKTMSCYHG